jgi:class 3 adenylate cyclase
VWLSSGLPDLIGERDPAKLGYGDLFEHFRRETWTKLMTPESLLKLIEVELPMVLNDMPGGKEELKRIAGPDLETLIDSLDHVGGRGDRQTRRLVGKHAGDGVTAFFLADDLGSRSAAVRAVIEAARDISTATLDGRQGARAGIRRHRPRWRQSQRGRALGRPALYGSVGNGGRLEVTALGDRVNEAARIQESARDGAILASKSLIEHLSDGDARALGLDPDAVVYRTIEESAGASDKARRDAGAIPVTSL